MSDLLLPGPVVSVDWLRNHLAHHKLVVLDATLKPVVATGPVSSLDEGVGIPGARFFDLDCKFSEQKSALPHMMPTPETFQREARALGINRDSIIVVYDRENLYSSPRARWSFKAMGHEQVAVLDGGLRAWAKADLPLQPISNQPPTQGNFTAQPRPELFCDADKVAASLKDKGCVVIDARSEGRFRGQEPEPRSGLRGGHMPGSRNVPYTLVQNDGHMRPAEELKALFAERAGRPQRFIFCCGSAVTACVPALAAELCGYRDITVYDGSWSEWGLPSEREVATDY